MKVVFFILNLFFGLVISSGQEMINLVEQFEQNNQVIAGDWGSGAAGITVKPGKASRCIVAKAVPADYRLVAEFTRTSGDDSVAFILPVGPVSPALEISAWQGAAHGLSRVNGGSARDAENPTSVRPGRITNGEKQTLEVIVKAAGSISAKLNGKELFVWAGSVSTLEPNFVMQVPVAAALGLAAQNSEVTFHSLELYPMQAAPVQSAEDELSALTEPGTPGWQPFHDAQFQVTSENGRQVLASVPNVGSGDRGAYLADSRFSEGTIEIDLKGAATPGKSFVGIVFHGIDGDNYDSVYFRPFNFGHRDPVRRGHAVQYMSHPDWGWAKLRKERPEEFENPANPEPKSNEWFRAKIAVSGQTVKVYINDAETPCLEVEKMSQVQSGKVGLWFNGIASFANLKITPKS